MEGTDIDYGMVMDVTLSWDRLKQSGPNYQETVGEIIFVK
jgi:hypothetical protein